MTVRAGDQGLLPSSPQPPALQGTEGDCQGDVLAQGAGSGALPGQSEGQGQGEGTVPPKQPTAACGNVAVGGTTVRHVLLVQHRGGSFLLPAAAWGARGTALGARLGDAAGLGWGQGCIGREEEGGGGFGRTPCVTFRLFVVPLRGPGRSPVLPFACCVGSLRSVGRCGRCSCWCPFHVRGAQWLVCWGCAGCGGMCRLRVSGAQ